jgi:hypothetical protein
MGQKNSKQNMKGMASSASMYNYKTILAKEKKDIKCNKSLLRMKSSVSFPVNLSETLRDQIEQAEAELKEYHEAGQQLTNSCESLANIDNALMSSKEKCSTIYKSKV